MRLHSLRSAWLSLGLAFVTAVLLASCGGGGSSTVTTGGVLQVFAPNTMYGGVPATITITGGRTPYTVTSNEPAVLPVPQTTSSSTITVLPANPGVVDTGLPPDALQIRTVTITVRDANGTTATGTTQVGQNFLTGYGLSFGSTTCSSGSPTQAAATVCSGGDTVIGFRSVYNGNIYGGREFRIDVLQGPITLVNPATNATGSSIGVTSDHTGAVDAIVRVSPNVQTQFATIRLTDVASGVSTIDTFIVTGGSASATLTVVPDTFTFTGPNDATCGTGTGDFLVFDGVPPYTAISSNSAVSVTYIDPNHNPGHFRISANNPTICLSDVAVIVTDSANAHGTVTVTTEAGANPATVPPTPVSVQPNAITLSCAQSGSVSVIGGSGGTGGTVTYSASSSNPNVTASVAGNTVTVTRAGPAGAGTGSTTSSVQVTDGSTVATISVTAPTTCP